MWSFPYTSGPSTPGMQQEGLGLKYYGSHAESRKLDGGWSPGKGISGLGTTSNSRKGRWSADHQEQQCLTSGTSGSSSSPGQRQQAGQAKHGRTAVQSAAGRKVALLGRGSGSATRSKAEEAWSWGGPGWQQGARQKEQVVWPFGSVTAGRQACKSCSGSGCRLNKLKTIQTGH